MTSPLPPLKTEGWSPKALAATGIAFLLSVLVPTVAAVVESLTDNPELFAGWSPIARVAVSAALVALGTALAAFLAGPGAVVPVDAERGYRDV